MASGDLTAAGGAAWFLLATLLVQHKAGGVFYAQQFYGDFGSTSAEVAQTVVTHPGRVLDRLQDADASQYGFEIASPYSLTSLLSPLALVIGSPQALLNLISVQDFTWRTQVYAALPVCSCDHRHGRQRRPLPAACGASSSAWSSPPLRGPR